MAVIINKLNAPHGFVHSTNLKEAAASSEIVTLSPGANEIPESDFAWIKNHPDFKSMVEQKQLVLVVEKPQAEGKGGGAAPKTPKNLDELDAQMALELVGATVDLEQIKAWQKNENRDSVKEALNKQVEVIKDMEKRANAAKSN